MSLALILGLFLFSNIHNAQACGGNPQVVGEQPLPRGMGGDTSAQVNHLILDLEKIGRSLNSVKDTPVDPVLFKGTRLDKSEETRTLLWTAESNLEYLKKLGVDQGIWTDEAEASFLGLKHKISSARVKRSSSQSFGSSGSDSGSRRASWSAK